MLFWNTSSSSDEDDVNASVMNIVPHVLLVMLYWECWYVGFSAEVVMECCLPETFLRLFPGLDLLFKDLLFNLLMP